MIRERRMDDAPDPPGPDAALSGGLEIDDLVGGAANGIVTARSRGARGTKAAEGGPGLPGGVDQRPLVRIEQVRHEARMLVHDPRPEGHDLGAAEGGISAIELVEPSHEALGLVAGM